MTGEKLYLLTEAAELTGATVETIRQRIKRRKLHAVKGNDGRVRVKLSDSDIAALKTGQPTSQPTGQPVNQLANRSKTAMRSRLWRRTFRRCAKSWAVSVRSGPPN